MGRALEVTGQVFGRLTAVRKAGKLPNGSQQWFCECECGGTAEVTSSNLKAGLVQSCGCLYKESRKTCHQTHGKSKSREYNSWAAMKQRCYYEDHDYWENYGGRGITVCDEWLHSFEQFYADMGDCPDGMSIERKDNDIGYSATNCKWDTPSNQGYNTRMHSNNKSTKTGVYWHKVTQKWAAAIRANGENIHLGVFDNFEIAVKVREAAELQYYGRIKE